MDQGEAAVWAAGLGIVGTLVGALGGALVQGLISKRQVSAQEAVDVRHRLREERRTAFAAVLDRCDEAAAALDPIFVARTSPEWRENGDHRELWRPANDARTALQRAVTTVRITGPEEMADLAQAIHDAALAKANSLREPGLEFQQRFERFSDARRQLERLRSQFVDAARTVLNPPRG